MYGLPPGLVPGEILLYSRKSRADDPTLSVGEILEKHEQMLDDWVARNLPGLGPVPEENRYREVVSGETIASRPEVQALLRKVESPRFRAVLIVEPQRLSRGDLEDIGRLVKLLRYSKTVVLTLPYNYDLTDARDRDDFERELKRGNEFLEYQKRIMNNGRLLAVENGNYIGTFPPYGFNKISYKEGKKKVYSLAPHPDQAAVVRTIFEWYAHGVGSTTIADRLNARKVPAPNGGAWTAEAIPRMLRNEHYIGKVRWYRRKDQRSVVDGEVVLSRPIQQDYLLFEGKHNGIIPPELWEQVQSIRGKAAPVKKDRQPFNPLAGLLFCECGRKMQARTYKTKGKTDSEPRVLCYDQKHCGNASALLQDVLDKVADVLRKAIADFELHIDDGTDNSRELHLQMIERMEKRLLELRELEIAQWDEKTKGGMPEHVFERLNGQTLKEIEELTHAIGEAKDATPEPIDARERQATFQAALDTLLDPDAPVREKNLLLKECIRRIDYKRERPDGGIGGNACGGPGRKTYDTPIQLHFDLRV